MNIVHCLCFVLNFVYPACLSYNIFTITRKSGGLQPQEDKFIVSNRYCYGNVPECELFKASRGPSQDNPCTCVCGDGMQTRTTLGHHNGSWKCIDNSLFRATEGCARQHLFPREKSCDGLKILPASDHAESLGVRKNNGISYSINHYNSYVYECNGTWSPLRKAAEKFEIGRMTINNGANWMYHLIVKNPNYTSLSGRVIKLGVDHSDVTGAHKGCLLFKLSGTTKCRDESIELLPLAPETTRTPTVHTSKNVKEEEKTMSPTLMMEYAEHGGQHKGRGYLSFGFIAIGVILSAVIMIGLPFMCCRKLRGNYETTNKDNHKGSEAKEEDLSNICTEVVLNKNLEGQECHQARLQSQDTCYDTEDMTKQPRLYVGGCKTARESKSVGDLSVYDNYMPPQIAISPDDDQEPTVNARNDHLYSDNESPMDGYPDYHVLEGPDPNAPSPSDVLF